MKKLVIMLASIACLNFSCATTTKTTDATESKTPTAAVEVPKDKNGMPIKKVSLDFAEMDGKEVLKMLFNEGKVSYVFAPNLPARPVNLKMSEVPWTEALNMVTESAGYNYSVDENAVVHITTGTMNTTTTSKTMTKKTKVK